MSVEGTAQALTKMLSSDEFTQQVADDPAKALAEFELDQSEREMVAEAAKRGLEKIFPAKAAGGAGGEMSSEELERVAGGGFSLFNYLNTNFNKLDPSTQTSLQTSINTSFGSTSPFAINL